MLRTFQVAVVSLGLWILGGTALASAPTVTVAAAASMTDALGALAERYQARSGVTVRLNFAASSALARQIEAGAPADVFLSADEAWMDYLAGKNLLRSGSRRDLVGNALVLVAASGSTACAQPLPMQRGHFDLPARLGAERLAVGDPDSVPAGRYAREALTALGVWDGVAGHLARAENVRAALQYVAHGEARYGIVYATDAQADRAVCRISEFPPATHAPIRYPGALTATSGAAAAAFLDFLGSADARQVWATYGFLDP